MKYKISFGRFLLAIILVNIIGFGLKFFGQDSYLILLGFRFHLSAILPLLLVIKKEHLSLIKESFLQPPFTHIVKVILAFLFTILLFFTVLFLINKIEIGDPDYFYEFGLSSIVDYPIYLIWNSIQFIFLYSFFFLIQNNFKSSFIVILISAVLIFAYEFIPLKKNIFDYQSISAFILLCVILSMLVKYFNNVYLFAAGLFSIIWINLLAFGTSSPTLVNLLYAAKYNEWEGFFSVDKDFSGFVIPASYFLLLLSLIILLFWSKRKFA